MTTRHRIGALPVFALVAWLATGAGAGALVLASTAAPADAATKHKPAVRHAPAGAKARAKSGIRSRGRHASRRAAATRPIGPAVAQSLRFYTGPNSTRLVLDLSRTSTFRIEPDSSARQFKVIVPGGMRSPALTAPAAQDGAVDSVEFAETGDAFELVVHVTQWYEPRVFGLEGGSGEAARVVIDVPRPGQLDRDLAERARIDQLSHSAHRIVVVDPGHGGEATGAVGPHHTFEKDVTLAIALKLKAELEKHQGVQVVLTRDGDYDVPLRERFKVAERYQADAFVSIHCNSSPRSWKGEGTEVYFLSLASASDEASKNLADAENAADRISAGPQVASGDDDLVGILYDMKANASMQQSSNLAESILDQIESGRRLTSRGLHQAGFAVLKSPIVPSVLVETAFINNPSEERLLKDPDFQEEMAEQIGRGVTGYLATAPVPTRGATALPASTEPAHLGVSR